MLDFVHQILGQFLFTKDIENVVGVGSTIHKGLAGLYQVSLVDTDVLAFGDQVLLGISDFRSDNHLAFPFGIFAKGNGAADLADHCLLFGFADFKELSHSWQTTGDVFGLGGLARDLGEDIASGNRIALGYHDDGAHRHKVTGCSLAYFGRLT